jgi:N-acetylglutamate synthase-like GNAT family acetyltransferase
VGKKLLQRLETYANRNEVKRIWLMATDELYDYYAANGYKESYSFLSPRIKRYLRRVKKIHALVKKM